MEDVASTPVLAGPSQAGFPLPATSERRSRKSGTANIFQGVNLKQLRRLFHAAGDPEADQRARMVWGSRRAGSGEDGVDGEEEEGGGGMTEVETGLAQALVGLRVRARNRNGIRESHKDTTGTRWVRAFGHLRINEGSLGKPSDVTTGDDSDEKEDDSSSLGACGGQSTSEGGSCDQGDFLSPGEETQGPTGGPRWSWNAVQEKDPERYLHRIRH
ncbi:uncharacterized protein avpi1 [Triplophysa rosa]|uniref:Arginine vasopressin-induced protein 1 n=1 Tax=Triplophysa rosa TaxID=992332 RepID=A0A9W7T4I1_TRIRA|nr:uncharacterized protein avpi1 [Triplophysa rosa]KAI7790475.1 putative arginine vasopressin-induced protein 1 [Triplophysa rosa]